MGSVLITGANRGIGLGLAKLYATKGWKVHACCRKPESADDLKAISGDVRVHKLNVLDTDDLDTLVAELKGQPIDILINNAGVYGPKTAGFGNIDYQAWADVFQVNSMAPLRVSVALLGNLQLSQTRKIVMISSQMGSMTDNSSGGSYIYRSSKAAINAVLKSLSVDLDSDGFTCVTMHPGWVQTDMGGPNALIGVDKSVEGLSEVINGLTRENNGQFLRFDGPAIPW